MKCKRCMLMKHLVNCIKSHQDSRRYLGLASCSLFRTRRFFYGAQVCSRRHLIPPCTLPPCSNLTQCHKRGQMGFHCTPLLGNRSSFKGSEVTPEKKLLSISIPLRNLRWFFIFQQRPSDMLYASLQCTRFQSW